jgi:hypothetical protein
MPGRRHSHSEGAALRRIDGAIGHELAIHSELDKLTGLIGVGIDYVAVADDQIAVRGENHGQRSVQVRVVLINPIAHAAIRHDVARICDGIDRMRPVPWGPLRAQRGRHGGHSRKKLSDHSERERLFARPQDPIA